MRVYCTIASLIATAFLSTLVVCLAKEPKNSAIVCDGFTKDRAIVVTEKESNYVQWEYQYLDKHFPGRTFPMEHAFIGDDPTMRAWDLHTFMWRGRKTEFWFDVTQQFREFAKKHPEIK